jgi:hypothetical protein
MAKKNPHAVALRKLAGSKPGKARAANLTAAELSAIGHKGGTIGGKARAAATHAGQTESDRAEGGGEAMGSEREAGMSQMLYDVDFDASKAHVVELRYFGRLNTDETAEVLKISTAKHAAGLEAGQGVAST